MSKERKFHEWIEEQNQEEKNRVWEKICERETEQKTMQQEQTPPVVSKTSSFSWRKWATVAASALAVVIIGVFSIVKFFPFDGQTPEISERYFDAQSYDIVETEQTIAEYAKEIEKDLLYFDWYEETDYLRNCSWQLKDTKEVICVQEEIVDINTGCKVYLFIVEKNIKMEAFFEYEQLKENAQINNVLVSWSMPEYKALVNFQYEDYKYYLWIDEPIDKNYVLSLVEELLS